MTADEHLQAFREQHLIQAHAKARRYMDEFIRLRCAPDLLALGIYPNVKEIQESAAAFHAVADHLGHERLGDRVALVAVGDGVAPRTGAMFAFRSNWRCWSVDPRMRMPAPKAARLICEAKRVEDWRLPHPQQVYGNAYAIDKWPLVVVVAVHSHAPLDAAYVAVAPVAQDVHVLAIPCCVGQKLPWGPKWRRRDESVGSSKREVVYWETRP